MFATLFPTFCVSKEFPLLSQRLYTLCKSTAIYPPCRSTPRSTAARAAHCDRKLETGRRNSTPRSLRAGKRISCRERGNRINEITSVLVLNVKLLNISGPVLRWRNVFRMHYYLVISASLPLSFLELLSSSSTLHL